MRSRGLQRSEGIGAPAADSRAWVRRVVLGGLGTAGVTVALAAVATSAFANAANPLPDASGSITLVGNGPAVQVTVGGTWNWGELSGSSVQKSCAGRSGVGWSVDWWGVSGSKTAKPITDGQLTGSLVTAATSSSTAPQPFTGNLDPVANFGWAIPSGGYFHTTHLFNGFDADLCKAPNSLDAQGFPQGPWSATATYPSAADVPAKLCVNFYDPHGQEGKYSTSSGDNYADEANDNSIKSNDFDPTLLKGYCFTPQFKLSMNVDKTNDANKDGTYSKTETAKVAGQDVTFQVTVQNTSAVAEVVDSVSDQVPSGAAGASVTCKDKNGNDLVGQTIAVGATATCTFTQSNYAPANGSLTDKVVVTVHESGNPGNSLSDSSESTVNAPPAAAHLAANIYLCSDKNAVLPNDGTLVTTLGPTSVPAANDHLASTLVDPGTYKVTATAPTGYHLAVCGNYDGSSAQTVTLNNGDDKTVDFFVVKNGTPNVTVAKDGPADGDLNGNGTYHIVATNSGDANSTATTFTDSLPDGEQFVAAGSSADCTAAGQTVTCTLGPLAANGGHQSFTVVVKYTKTGKLTDCATIAGQAVPSCVDTTVHQPNVTVKKTGPSDGDLNGNGTYTIVATNNGDADSTATTFTDTLPDGESFVSSTGPGACSAAGQVVTCQLGALSKNGGSATYTVTVKYTKTGKLTDCATIDGQAVPSCVDTTVHQPNVTVAKTGPSDGDLNGNGTYTIVATNNGDADSTATTFTDTLPDGESFVSSTGPGACSAAGQVVTCQLGALSKNGGSATYTVTVKYTKTGKLTDCATIAGQAVPSCVDTTVHQPNVTVAKTGPTNGDLNGNGTYTIVATNNGDADSKATTFTDTLPDGESFVSSTGPGACSAVGQVVTCQLGALTKNGGSATYTVTVTYTKTGALKDCATIDGQAVPSCVTTNVHQPNVTVAKSGPATGLLGDNGTYTIVATNNGDGASKATTFTDTLPAGETFVAALSSPKCSAVGQVVTCQLGALDAKGGVHDSESFTVVVAYTQTGQLTDCATIAGQPVASCVTTTVLQPNLQVRKTGPATGTLNGQGTYTMVVTNNGNGNSTATTFTDTLPAGETLVSATGPGTCSSVGQVVTCQVPALNANGGSVSYTVVVSYTKTGDLTDCATIGGQPVPSCVTTHIPGTPSLSIVKTNDADGDGVFHDSEVASAPGQAVTFKVVITNTSTDPIVIDSISDAFDATTLAECPNLLTTVLNPGDSVSCVFTVDNYAPAAGTSLTNTVTVGGHQTPGGTPVTATDTSTVTTKQPVTPGPDLAIVKNADLAKVKAGDTLTYTLSVTNVGDGPTTGAVTVTDSIPAGLDLVSVSGGTAWDCTANGRDITCTYLGGTVVAGQKLPDITVTTTVNDTAVGSVVNTGVVTTPGDVNPLNDRSTVKTPVTKVLGEKTVKTPPTTTTPQVLPFTGDRTGQMLPAGLGAVLLGLMVLVAGRRRRRTA